MSWRLHRTISQSTIKKKKLLIGNHSKFQKVFDGEGAPYPMRRRVDDRCGWRIEGWRSRPSEGWRARALVPAADGQMSSLDWLLTVSF